jgi:hypothetical protein
MAGPIDQMFGHGGLQDANFFLIRLLGGVGEDAPGRNTQMQESKKLATVSS